MSRAAKCLFMITAMAILAMSQPALAQAEKPEPYQEGLHYFEIEQAPVVGENQMELTELFSYLCTHCNTFEPYLNSWLKRKPEYVEFRRIPVIFGRGSWELYARAYATSQMMDVPEEAHQALMDLLWKEKNILRSMDELADFYAGFGLDKDKFMSTSKSFAVDGQLRKDQLLVQSYGIRGTPSLVLNGKYRITGNSAVPSFDAMLNVVDYLIEKESASMKPVAAEVASGEPETEGS